MKRTTRMVGFFLAAVLGLPPSFVVCVVCAGRAAAAEPVRPTLWQDHFLTATPAEVVAAAKDADDADTGWVSLFDEEVHTFDADGTDHQRWHRAYKLLSQGAVDGTNVTVGWAPWRQDQPLVKARVITRDGRAYDLDPKTIELSGSAGEESDMYTDRRLLRAPLPGLAPGAVVEEEVVITSRPVASGVGVSGGFLFGATVPTRQSRLVLDAPRSLPLAVRTLLGDRLRTTRTETGDRVRIVYDIALQPAIEAPDDGWPSELPWAPRVRFASGPGWPQLAQHYARVVDQQLAGVDLAAWINEARNAAPVPRSRTDLMARLLERLHAQVRYTGVEFSDASIVPRRPAEVLARGYGDCKDQAALLVALLRGAGIPAHVALLRVGGSDTDPTLPSLDGFDHAIVYVPAVGAGKTAEAPAVWIDPTAAYAPLGELPMQDVNRYALVAAPRTLQPLLIPVEAAGQARARELRRIILSDTAPPRVIEQSESEGGIGRQLRASWIGTERKSLEQHLAGYVRDEYGAKSLVKFELPGLRDVSKPARLDLEAQGSDLASVWEGGARVGMRTAQALLRLPEALRGDHERPPGTRPRQVDLVIREPYRYEIRYEITPPHGYSADPLPAGGVRNLGTASMRSTYAVDARGVVTAAFVFDTGKIRLTPAEVERTRADVKAFMKGDIPNVRFHADGPAALAAGKVRDAIGVFRRLDQEHPGQALHARQLADALLTAGLGLAAREQAQRAVDADPRDAQGYRLLGWILEHDPVGRQLGFGADLAGAEAAYRRALALDSQDRWTLAALAILLEYDGNGQRTYPAKNLDEVARLYEQLAQAGEKKYEINALEVMIRQRRFADVIAQTQSTTDGERRAFYVAAVALQQGPEAALREATARWPVATERSRALHRAGALVTRLRRYPEAAALYEQAANDAAFGANLRIFATRLRRARRYEDVTLNPKKPADVVKAVVAEMWLSLDQRRPLSRTLIEKYVDPQTAAEMLQPLSPDMAHTTVSGLNRSSDGLPLVCLVDLFMAVEGDIEGDPKTGYRVRLPLGLTNGMGEQALVAALPDRLALTWLHGNTARGAGEVLRLLRVGRLDAARTWLDWVLADESASTGDDPLAGSLLARVWSRDEDHRKPANMELAAAVLLSGVFKDSELRQQAVRILTRERAAPEGTAARRQAIDLALGTIYTDDGRFTDAEPVLADLWKANPQSEKALYLWLTNLSRRGQQDQAIRVARAYVDAHPDDVKPQTYLAEMYLHRGKLADAEAIYARMVAAYKDPGIATNQLAWLRLCRGDSSAETLKIAETGVERTQRGDRFMLHTLATILAERDQPERARDALLDSLAHRRSPAMINDDDKYILGRMAESYGFFEQARALYRQVAPSDRPPAEIKVYALAQRRLSRLPPPPTAPAPAAVVRSPPPPKTAVEQSPGAPRSAP